MASEKILIKNGLVVDGEGHREEDILIDGSKIAKVGKNLPSPDGCACRTIDAKGLLVLPGAIDAHTHYHLVSRGTVTADSFPQGSRCAAFGGVTTVVDFADHDKGATLPQSMEARLAQMGGGMVVDYALHQGVYRMGEGVRKELEAVRAKGIRAVKLFTTYKDVGYMIDDPGELERLFSICKELGLLVCVHCEADSLIQEINASWTGTHLPKDHALLRPAAVEAEGIRIVGELALRLDMPLYIVHLSSAAGLARVRELRSRGARLFVETTPHYLFLDRSKLEGGSGPLFVMTPPLRDKEDGKALRGALVNGEIQTVATDHCSFTYAQKLESSDCRTIYPGIPGSEELLGLLYSYATKSGLMPVEKVVRLVSENPAKIFGLYPRKGALKEGSDADVVLYDPAAVWKVSKDSVHSASGYSVYEGFELAGRVRTTIRRGAVLVDGGRWLGKEGSGVFLSGGESAAYKEGPSAF